MFGQSHHKPIDRQVGWQGPIFFGDVDIVANQKDIKQSSHNTAAGTIDENKHQVE